MIGRAAVPMALLVAGAGLKFGPGGSRWSGEIAASVLKLLVMPAGGFLVTHFMGLEGMVRAVIILMLALPAPPSAYVLACQMGGDAPLMARIISLQMILSLFYPAGYGISGRHGVSVRWILAKNRRGRLL